MTKKDKLELVFLPTQLYVDLLTALGGHAKYGTHKNYDGYIFLDKFFVMDVFKRKSKK